MNKLTILKYPDPILNKKTKAVTDFEKVKEISNQMWPLLKAADGVGLSANQIGISQDFFVIGFEPTEKMLENDPELKPIPKHIIINAKLTWHSKETSLDKEGCLSVPNIEVFVPRYQKIHIDYHDENGNRKKMKAKGFLARAIQHEMDHLSGKLILDYQKAAKKF